MTLALELGQVADDHTRRALEQIVLAWPAGTTVVPIVTVLPVGAPIGALVYRTGGTPGLFVQLSSGWVQT